MSVCLVVSLIAAATSTSTTSTTTTTAIAPVRRTLTSTVFVTTVRVPSRATTTDVEAPVAPPKPPPEPPEALGMLLLGMHSEYGVFFSPFLADRMAAISAQQPMQGDLSKLVLLFGFGFTAELRLLPALAIVPAITYLFTPRFFSVSVETDGTIDTELSFAQAFTGSGRVHGYIPLSGWTDLVIGAGPSIVHARFRGRGETALGLEGRLGLQFHNHDLPDARLLGTLRYAPIDFGDGVELDLTGVGLVADLVFGVL